MESIASTAPYSDDAPMAEGIPPAEQPPLAKSLLSAVSSALDKRAGKDMFAIGGSIKGLIYLPEFEVEKSDLALRWDIDDQGHSRSLKLPVNGDAVSQESFGHLLKDCEPATFGLGNEEVLDEDYRKAGKLDKSQFSSSFNPYEHGVVDTISQALAQGNSAARGVRAELYKLNIYSGPSGKFKAHVDTPRSDLQMGSLVVCLPVEHKGGQLVVRHGGRQVVFDWASQSASMLQWAAFFSDCNHEVLEVTDGHRVTLTYNLFWTSYGPASMAHHLHALDQESLHFFSALEELLTCAEFLEDGIYPPFKASQPSNADFFTGGLVGFTCTHAYPHTSKSSLGMIHHSLKGIDMVVYQALTRILGAAQVTAVLDKKKYQERLVEEYRGRRGRPRRPSDAETAEPVMHLATALERTILWDSFNFYDGQLDPATVRIPDLLELPGDSDKPVYPRQGITWLNHPPDDEASRELAIAFLAYGNEPSLDAYYSSAVIVARVKGKGDASSSSSEGSF
ncbi:hypothetical protein ACJ41O_001734 [Fusarium nematophilum]